MVSPVACAIERYTLRSAGDDRDRILWTGPQGPGRANLVVRTSYDDCKTWSAGKALCPGPAGYSDLTVAPDGTILCLYERGDEHPYQTLTLARFAAE